MDLSDKNTVIFDVDGVLVDSEPLSCGALSQILEEEHGIVTGNDFSKVLGTSNSYAFKYYLDQSKVSYDETKIQSLVQLKEDRYKLLADQQLVSFHDCENFIRLVLKLGFRIAVASSGSLEKIQFSLTKVNLISYFDHFNSASEVVHGKPAPDLFELAMKRLGVDPEKCIVIEDSLLGIQSAQAAGIDVLGFVGSFDRESIEGAGIAAFDNYTELIQFFKEQRG